MSERKHRLVDCNPRWGTRSGNRPGCYITFDCPEGHEGCTQTVPFAPALDGHNHRTDGWGRTGTSFETLTLTPSIRRIPAYASREAAIAEGCISEHVTEALLCALHVNITNGAIEFCGDSK